MSSITYLFYWLTCPRMGIDPVVIGREGKFISESTVRAALSFDSSMSPCPLAKSSRRWSDRS